MRLYDGLGQGQYFRIWDVVYRSAPYRSEVGSLIPGYGKCYESEMK